MFREEFVTASAASVPATCVCTKRCESRDCPLALAVDGVLPSTPPSGM
jgi:hypothetical protein